MMVRLKLGQGSHTGDIVVDSSRITIAKLKCEGKEDSIKLNVSLTHDQDEAFDLTEAEFKTARKKLLAGKPNTVIEIATKQTRPWVYG